MNCWNMPSSMATTRASPKPTSRKALASGKDVILRIDVQGAATIRRLIPEAVTIFLVAENEVEQMRRLRERKTETSDRLKMRIATARKELQQLHEFHYVVVNRDDCQEETVDKVIQHYSGGKMSRGLVTHKSIAGPR